MNQKGFTNIVLAGIIVMFLAIAGYFAVIEMTKLENQPPMDNIDWWNLYESDLGYWVNYPPTWVTSSDQISPAQPEIFNGMPVQYFMVRIEDQSLETIRQNNNKNIGGQNLIESEIILGGKNAYAYTEKFPNETIEFYEVLLEHNGKVFRIWTQKYNLDEVKQIFSTFEFTTQ